MSSTCSKPIRGMGLKRPCKHCPFRTDVPRYLDPERYKDIAASLVDRGESFSCHETIGFDHRGKGVVTPQSRVCAGAMIWLQHQQRPNQIMQVMERLGAWSPSYLDLNSPVYRTREAFEAGTEDERDTLDADPELAAQETDSRR